MRTTWRRVMKTKQLTFLLALTFLFLFSSSSVVFGDSMGISCSKTLVHFGERKYQANNKFIKVLSVSKLDEI